MAAMISERAYARGLAKKQVLTFATQGDLVLYGDAHGRAYALPPVSLGGAGPGEAVLDDGYVYVLFPTRRGLAYDATEEDLGARATMPQGYTVRITLRTRGNTKNAPRDYPRALELCIEDIYRVGMRCSAIAACTIMRA